MTTSQLRSLPLIVLVVLLVSLFPTTGAAQAHPFTVYTNPSYTGSFCFSDTPMSANIYVTCNDQISSIQFAAGWSARLYRDQNEGGPSFCLSRTDGDLGDNSFEDGSPANDTISSFVLYNQPWCGGAPTPAYPLEAFNDPGYAGGWCYSWRAETANIFAGCDNQISSVLLRAGWSARVYRDLGQAGPSRCLTGSDDNLSDNSFEDGSALNNAISSFALYNQTSCPGTSVPPTPTPPPPPAPASFLISGFVRLPDQIPVPNVQVFLVGPTSANTRTGTDGAYTFIGLETGTYTVRAELRGMTMTPSSYTVTGPPNSVERNFSATGDVVVMVHGWQGRSTEPVKYGCSNGIIRYGDPKPRTTVTDFDEMPSVLAEDNFLVYFAQWTTGNAGTMSRDAAANCLASQIAAVRGNDTDGKVLLVAHSMGGLVSRNYLETNKYANDVERLITFGTPHAGVDIATIGKFLAPGQWNCDDLNKTFWGTCELSSASTQWFNLNHTQRAGVRYDFVSGTGGKGNKASDKAFNAILWSIVGPHDGIVGLWSGQGFLTGSSIIGTPKRGPRSVQGKQLHFWKTGDGHTLGWASTDYFTFKDSQKSGGALCLRSLMQLSTEYCAGDGQVLNGLATLSQAEEAPSAPAAFTPTVTGTLAAGQSQTIPLPLQSDETGVVLSWDVGTVQFQLTAPDGTVLTPDNVAQTLPGAEYIQLTPAGMRPLVSYYLPRPVAGVWNATITALTSPGTTTYMLYGIVAGQKGLTVSLPDSAEGGKPVVLTVQPHGSTEAVTGAAVSVRITTSGGVTNAPLTEIAPGNYTGTLTAPTIPGQYLVSITAVGPNGSLFARQEDRLLVVRMPGLTLGGVAAAVPADTNGNGFADQLRIDAPVQVSAPGAYVAGATLLGPRGEVITTARQELTLSAGDQTITLAFSGAEIAAARINGPYTVALIIVGDAQVGVSLAFDEPALVQTSSYQASEFGDGLKQPAIYLPLLWR